MKNFIRTMMATAVMAIFCFVGQAVAEITVASWGGAYTMSQQKAYADTFSDSPLIGGKANFVNYNGGLGEVRTQVESGNVQWDIVDVLPHEARVGCDEGLFEELPRNVFAKAPDGTPMDEGYVCSSYPMTVLFRRFGGPTWRSTRKVPSQAHSPRPLETSSTLVSFRVNVEFIHGPMHS